MKVSLNWIKRYIDFPADLTPEQIAYDLTMRTVEVEGVERTADKYHDIIVGKIITVSPHPNADMLRVCMVDVGDGEPKQIVCGGSNLYDGENVVVCRPGAEVYWHGEDKLVKIGETKMRGEKSWGMICSSTEVFLEGFYPLEDERQIVDLGDIECHPGQPIVEIVDMDDFVLEIDNKSLTNRPDLWGHYGIARELAAIYDLELRPEPVIPDEIKALPEYKVTIEAPERCPRYAAVQIENVCVKESPNWLKASLINAGMRPINAIVDITNYAMLGVGQPTHAFDKTHVGGDEIIVRKAGAGETLELLNQDFLELTEDDLVICDATEPMALAGIRGGKKDSILPETTSVLLEVANFTAAGIRKTGKRFDEKTDAGIRYEKGLDTEHVNAGAAECIRLFRELFPEVSFTAYADNYPLPTERAAVDITQSFLDSRLGKVIDRNTIERILTKLGFDVEFDGETYHTLAPVWRSTGDISIHDDIEGEIARILCYESFEAKPLKVRFEHAVNQPEASLQRSLREYLAFRCGFNEIFTYPWIDEKYIKAAKIDTETSIKLDTPPSPEQSNLRRSLIPGALEATVKNLRYFDEFSIFEMAQAFEPGEYHESSQEETLPVHKMLLTGAAVGQDAKSLFFRVKGVIEGMVRNCQMEEIGFKQKEKPSWADEKVYLNIVNGAGKVVGALGLVSVSTMSDCGIKRAQIAAFELDVNMLKPNDSRSNEFRHMPQFPLVEQDFSVLVDETVKWHDIREAVRHMVKDVEFIEEYRGKQIPEGKKSLMFRVWMGNDDSTMTSKQINSKVGGIVKVLKNKCNAELRDE